MIDKEKAKEAIAEMCKNQDWKDVLSNAPGAAKIRVSLAFYASKNLSEMDQKQKDEYREFREMLERQLNAVELKYLAEEFKRMGVEAAATHYQELFSKKPPEEQTSAEQEYQEIVKKAAEGKGKVSDFMSKYGPDAGKGDDTNSKEDTAENTDETKLEEKPEDEQKPEGEETQDEAPAGTASASPQQVAVSPAPAESSAGKPASAEQESLPGFSDDDMKAFLERGKAMLTKGIRVKGAKKEEKKEASA